MTIETAAKDATHKMEQAVAHLKDDLAGIRTGRAATGRHQPCDGRVLRDTGPR
jgi:ribosome recycling factor